jgi:hypothetical protein
LWNSGYRDGFDRLQWYFCRSGCDPLPQRLSV